MNSDELSAYIEQKYKKAYEPIGHWCARKQFLLRNWADYSERRVVSLSMVWSNMEYDGSIYASDLMEHVKELARGLDPHGPVDSYFQPKHMEKKNQFSTKTLAQEPISNMRTLPFKYKIKFQKQEGQDEVSTNSHQLHVNNQKDICKDLPEPLKLFISKLPSQSNILHSNAEEKLYTSANDAGVHIEFDFTERKYSMNKIKKGNKKKSMMKMQSIWICTLFIGDLLICFAEHFSKVEAKQDCIADAIDKLFNPELYVKYVDYCSLENGRKYKFELCVSGALVTVKDIEKSHDQTIKPTHKRGQNKAIIDSINNDKKSTKITAGIGMEILKKMGWSGEGGLGKNEQGRMEPVLVEQRGYRKGFGFSNKMLKLKDKQTKKGQKKKCNLSVNEAFQTLGTEEKSEQIQNQTSIPSHLLKNTASKTVCVSKLCGIEIESEKCQTQTLNSSDVDINNDVTDAIIKPIGTDAESKQIHDQTLSSNFKTYSETSIKTSRFGNFIILETEESTHKNPVATLMNSAKRNNVNILFEISNMPVKYKDSIGYVGTLTLGGKVIAHVVNDDQKAVKRSLAGQALEVLKSCCYTIKTRFPEYESAQNSAINMESIRSEVEDNLKARISTSAINMDIFKNDSEDLSNKEQVVKQLYEERIDRDDFDTDVIVAAPTENVLKEMVRNFAVGDRQDDLIFSSDLCSDQRKVLHNTCRKFKLTSTSYGKDDNRYIVISRKRDAQQLAEYLSKKGGSTLQYTLVSPGPH